MAAWEARRNHAGARMYWCFTTAEARIKLTHLYPIITLPVAERIPTDHDHAA